MITYWCINFYCITVLVMYYLFGSQLIIGNIGQQKLIIDKQFLDPRFKLQVEVIYFFLFFFLDLFSPFYYECGTITLTVEP